MNRFKENKEIKKKSSSNGIGRTLVRLFSGDFLSLENVVGSLPFVFFLTFLGILYIANGYYTERMVRDIYKVANEVKELRSEYITIKSDLNFQSKQSQVAEATVELGIKESTVPPTKIIVSEKDMHKINVVD